MLDQTFSARNFKRVYDSENRKGRNVDKAFFPDLVEANLAISATTESIRDMRKANVGATREQVDALVAPLYAQLRTNRAARDVLVDAKAEEVSRDVRENHYQMQLRRADGPNNMTVYPIVSDPCSYFIGKQLQRNISALYKVKSANRRQIIDQLRDILATKFRTYVVRTDISTFYESIDRSTLIREIDADQLLSLASKSFIRLRTH